MAQTMTDQQLEKQLAATLLRVEQAGQQFVIEKDGKPVAAIVPFGFLDQFRRDQEGLADAIEALREEVADLSEEEAMALALEEVAAYRREKVAPSPTC